MIYAYIFSWLIGIPFIYFLLLYIYKKNNLYQKITINNNKEDTIVSHIITSLICFIYLSISGIRLYNRYSNILFEDKYIFKKNDDIINHIVIPMIIYQGWNTVITYLHKDLYLNNIIQLIELHNKIRLQKPTINISLFGCNVVLDKTKFFKNLLSSTT